jgi:hypothetical protein
VRFGARHVDLQRAGPAPERLYFLRRLAQRLFQQVCDQDVRASVSAMPRPMPRAPPVMMATWPLRGSVMFVSG